MGYQQEVEAIYSDMHSYYAVARSQLPTGFEHRELMDLGKHRVQDTNCSCGRWMGLVGMKAQNIPIDVESPTQMNWLRQTFPTHKQGIDPGALTIGMKAAGVECRPYANVDTSLLTELLRACPSVCILAIQAPWGELVDIVGDRMSKSPGLQAGHYVAAGHVDLRRREVYVLDSGNGSPWGRIKLKHLPLIWRDRYIKSKKIFHNWLLWIPVKNQ